MLPIVINPLPLLFTLTAAFGVLVHDTRIDQAATTALALPVAIASYGMADYSLKLSDGHIHTERLAIGNNLQNLASTQPRLQPRDDERNSVQKRLYTGGSDNGYAWPSV